MHAASTHPLAVPGQAFGSVADGAVGGSRAARVGVLQQQQQQQQRRRQLLLKTATTGQSLSSLLRSMQLSLQRGDLR
jgi:hypothetical protein